MQGPKLVGPGPSASVQFYDRPRQEQKQFEKLRTEPGLNKIWTGPEPKKSKILDQFGPMGSRKWTISHGGSMIPIYKF